MPPISPLLRCALEVFDHSLYHYFRSDTSLDLKFALMHLDQGIELLLKERVRKSGTSIYRKDTRKETISSWEAFEILANKGCAIPERADLELLHDDRNEIQHRYTTYTPEAAVFHMSNGFRFVARFLKDEFAMDILNVLPKEYVVTILGK